MRNRIFDAIVVVAAVAVTPVFGQMHKVAKSEKVVRAIGVYEWTGDLSQPSASRLVPVAIYIDSEFQDAGVYVARPIPFALETGNIYELEDSGVPKGTLDLAYAKHLKAEDSQGDQVFEDGWLGYGTYHAPPLTATAARLKQSKSLPVIQTSGGDDSGKPHLTNKSDSNKSDTTASTDPDRPTMKRHDSGSDSSASGDGSNGGSGKGSSGSSSGNSSGNSSGAGSSGGSSSGNSSGSASTTSSDDPDRPTMKRKSDTDSDTTASNGGGSGGSGSDNDPDRPTLKRRSPDDKKSQKEPNVSMTGGGSALNDDPDRPKLHHTQGGSDDKGLSELRGFPTDMHQMVAVSDASNRQTHVFARAWEDETERAMVLVKMQALARAQLAAYKMPLTPPTSIASTGPAGSTHTATPSAAPPADSSTLYARAEQDPGAPTLHRGASTQAKQQPQATAPAPSATTSSATAATKTTATNTTAAKTAANSRTKKTAAAAPAQVALLDEDLRGYTLSYGGDPTFVYMAHTDGVGAPVRYVTVVVQANGMGGGLGDLKLAIASVTDAGHFDHTPRMRFIDAVDAEASNRASLLFELRSASSRQFALYRVIAAKPEQIFVTGTTE